MENQLTWIKKRSYKSIIIELICYAYIILFIYAAFYKLFDYGLFIRQLEKSPLIGPYRFQVAWLIPTSEILIALLLFFQRTKLVGLIAATLLMTAFTLYIAYILLYAPHVPCSCGGIMASMDWGDHLRFNGVFVLLGLISIHFQRKINSS